jgi:hypothetical protein
MALQDIVSDSTPAMSALCVNWFRRDPGGSLTCFVAPPGRDGAASQPVAEHDDAADATHG